MDAGARDSLAVTADDTPCVENPRPAATTVASRERIDVNEWPRCGATELVKTIRKEWVVGSSTWRSR